jgi:hypothetical protein
MRRLGVPVGPAKLLLARCNADQGAQLTVMLLVTLRLSLELAGVVSMRLVGAPHQSYPLPADELINDYNVIDASGSMWQRWDASWYQKIAERGYDAGDGGVHFGVLYPAVSKGEAVLLGGQIVLAEIIVASLAPVAAMYLNYRRGSRAAADLRAGAAAPHVLASRRDDPAGRGPARDRPGGNRRASALSRRRSRSSTAASGARYWVA